MSRPPRYSRRHFDWGEPVGADGSIPLDILMEWLRDNRTLVRRSSNLYETVNYPCLQLNHCGVKCTADNIIREFDCLTMTAWKSREVVTGPMYTSDLFDMYFDGQNPDLVHRHREKHIRTRDEGHAPAVEESSRDTPSRPRLNWLSPGPGGGRSLMQILVDWFPGNYETFAESQKEAKSVMLKQLCEEMVSAGHCHCTAENTSRKIQGIVSEWHKETNGCHRSEAFNRYHDFFVNFFSGYENERASLASENDDEAMDVDMENESGSSSAASENDDEAMDADVDNESRNSSAASEITDENMDSSMVCAVETEDQTRRQEAPPADAATEGGPPPRAANPPSIATGPSSRDEVERIAALLRERQDLEQRGIPKEVLDSLLPLPRV